MQNQKLVVSTILILFVSILSCKKDNSETVAPSNLSSSTNSIVRETMLVSKSEYLKLNVKEKHVADLLNSAVAGLEALNSNESHGDYVATIYLNKDLTNKFSNFMVISRNDIESTSNARIGETDPCSGSCTITGIPSGISCANSIGKSTDACGEVDVTVTKNKSGGYNLTWKKHEK
jgi:hypothetical protein